MPIRVLYILTQGLGLPFPGFRDLSFNPQLSNRADGSGIIWPPIQI